MAATSTPVAHYGVTLSYATSSGGSYTEITDIKMLTPPNIDRGEVDITNLASPDMVKEFFPGWINIGEIPFTAYFTDTRYTLFLGTFMEAVPEDALYWWKIQLPAVGADTVGASIVAPGFLQSMNLSEITTQGDGVVELPCAIKVTGDIIFTEGSAA